MKGVVFTEFLELVETEFGLDVADRILSSSDLSTGGAYTTVGTYDHRELIQLVGRLSDETELPASALVEAFGEHLCRCFVASFPELFAGADNAFDFLASVEGIIHSEVRKLYPDAELPTFEYGQSAPGKMEMTYRSTRPFADLAEGLIHASIAHFGGEIDVVREDLEARDGTAARFCLTVRQGALACPNSN
ncbi:MAG: heme NO-binding domain-containing protein [Planctomycetales bacterium]|nr:heme NO-binding domain-containing protein [Planctomycetales bacterium]